MVFGPILAENFGPYSVIGLVIVPVLVVLLTLICIPLNRTYGRRHWWGLIAGLIPVLGGLYLLYGALKHTHDGGLEDVIVTTYGLVIAAIPLTCGLYSLHLWRRPPKV